MTLDVHYPQYNFFREHFARAEELLAVVHAAGSAASAVDRAALLAAAQVHATLALAVATDHAVPQD